MKKRDNLRAYMKEIQGEQPSDDFTTLVMERVRVETIKSTSIYEPLIDRQAWLKIFFGIIFFVGSTSLLCSFYPGNEGHALTPFGYQIDFVKLFKPFQLLSNALNGLSMNFFLGMAAISLLLFADQLYARFSDR